MDGMENASVPRVNPEEQANNIKDNVPSDTEATKNDSLDDKSAEDVKDKVDSADDEESSSTNNANNSSSESGSEKEGNKSDNENSGKDSEKEDSDSQSQNKDSDTSSSKKQDEEEQNDEEKKKKQQKKMARKGASAGAQIGVKALLAAKLAQMMKLMLLFLMNAANAVAGIFGAILSAIWSGLQAIGSAIAGFFSSAVSMVATAIGVGVTTVAVGFIGGGVLLCVGVFSAVVGMSTDSTTARTDVPAIEDCMSGVKIAADELSDETSVANPAEEMKANAKIIYFAYKELGLTDNMIAGALANFQAECSIDPTLVEGTYADGHYNIMGEKHLEALGSDPANPSRDKLDAWTKKVLSQWATPGSYYAQTKTGQYLCGMGLGQWTGPTAEEFLALAKSEGVPWYDMSFQVTYSIKGYRPGFFKDWVQKYNPENGVVKRNFPGGAAQNQFKNTPQDMGTYFSYFYEGNSKMAQEDRRKYAKQWVLYFPDWEAGRTDADTANAQSILAAAQATKIDAATETLNNKKKDCKNTHDIFAGGNGSIAEAGASYAYAKKEESVGNNGTTLYRKVLDAVIGDNLYQSCDRCVCGAVRWAGADDSFPAGNTTAQAQYLAGASDKWQEITDYNGDMTKLQPGDVLVITDKERGSAHGHIVLFAGYDAIKAAHPEINDANVTVVAASYGERSAACQGFYEELKKYTAYRNIKTEDSSKYKNVLADQKPEENPKPAPVPSPAPAS